MSYFGFGKKKSKTQKPIYESFADREAAGNKEIQLLETAAKFESDKRAERDAFCKKAL